MDGWNRATEDIRMSEPRALFQLSLNDLQNGADLRVTIGDAAGTEGYSSLQIDALGGCVYTYATYATSEADPWRTVPTWRQASFKVSNDTTHQLRQLLIGLDFPAMKAIYSRPRAGEHVQRFIKVAAGGRIKGVYCDNAFPPQLEQVRAFLESHVIAPNRDAIALAPLADAFVETPELAAREASSFDD